MSHWALGPGSPPGSLSTEPPLALLVLSQRPEVVPLPDVPPVDVGKIQFGVDGLPDHEIREAFPAGLYDEVRVDREDEFALDVVPADVGRVELSGVDLASEFPDGGGELVLSAEADTHQDRRVGTLVVTGAANRDRPGRVHLAQFPAEPVDCPRVEDAHVDDHPLGVELDGPPEAVFQRGVGAPFEQVPFREDDRNRLREGGVAVLQAGCEVPVVETHGSDTSGIVLNVTATSRAGSETVSSSRGNRGSVTSTVRRAGGFVLVGTLSLSVPAIAVATRPAVGTVTAPAPYIVVAALALYVFDDGTLFELFARPGDRRDGRLYGLAGFALAAAGLALLAVRFGLPMSVYVGTVLLLSWGNLGGHVVRSAWNEPILATAGFVLVGFSAGLVGQYAGVLVVDADLAWPLAVFLAASGALLGALLRVVLFERDDPLVMLSVGLLLWLFADLPLEFGTRRIAVALAITVALGYLSYVLETASLPGMLTGVLLGLFTIVLGGRGWFVILIAFFAVGGLSTKFRYDRKQERGIAEDNEGARGSGNVLANSLAGLAAVLGYVALPSHTSVPAMVFLFVFAGSFAAATADTMASEIGGVFDGPRLVTTLERVEPGTDGAVTWQGQVAGLAGATVIAAIAAAMFVDVSPAGAAVVVVAGLVGMTVDSLLGATLEGRLLENEGVNLAATCTGALTAGVLAVAVDAVTL